jgi:hypothetical protein
LGEKKEETVEGGIRVSTRNIWQLPTEEEEREKYRQIVRANNALAMPDACCKSCGKIFKPWSFDRNQQSWPPYDDVPCPKCGKMVRVYWDKKLERDLCSRKLLEESELGKFKKEFAQFKTEVLTRVSVLELGYTKALEDMAKNLEKRVITLLDKQSEHRVGKTSLEDSAPDKKQTVERERRYTT